MKQRLDAYLSDAKLVKSRTLAQSLIKDGKVFVNNRAVMKASFSIDEADVVEIIGEMPRYVGRGGYKLEKALTAFPISVSGLTCLDIGASTGGFTDCLIQKGAEKVYAVDVGTDQLDESLRANEKVVSLEKLDIRKADKNLIVDEIDFVCTDVSFISLKFILPEIKRFLKCGGYAVALIKPQFEAGKKNLNKNGIVKDKHVHKEIVDGITAFSQSLGFLVVGVCESPIEGGDGNKEYLLCLRG